MKWDELKNKEMSIFGNMKSKIGDQFTLMAELPEQKKIILHLPKVGAAVKFLEEYLGKDYEVVVDVKSVTITHVG